MAPSGRLPSARNSVSDTGEATGTTVRRPMQNPRGLGPPTVAWIQLLAPSAKECVMDTVARVWPDPLNNRTSTGRSPLCGACVEMEPAESMLNDSPAIFTARFNGVVTVGSTARLMVTAGPSGPERLPQPVNDNAPVTDNNTTAKTIVRVINIHPF